MPVSSAGLVFVAPLTRMYMDSLKVIQLPVEYARL